MNAYDLFRAVGEVREDQVAEAEHLHKRKHPWRRYGALAACLAAPRLLPGPRPPRMLS